MSLATLLAETAARVADRPALIDSGETVTYARLDALAEAAVPDDRIAVLQMPNTAGSVAAFHGALRHGSVVVPLNPLLSRREAERMRRPFDPQPETAVALYTSGTTGEPKRVELSHEVLRTNAEALADAIQLGENDVLFGSAPLAHVFGLTACMNAAIAAGAGLALLARFDAHAALDLIERERVTVFMGVPAMLTALLEASDETGRAPRMRLAHVGAAPLAPTTLRAFEERFGATVLEGYGMTEAGGVVTVHHAGRVRKPGSVGTAVSGTEVRVADDGEVLVRSGGNWFESGDVGRLDDDGYLFLIDRKKDVILRGGYSVYPREVEEVLLEHPSVREVAVVGVPDERLGEEVVAVVVGDATEDNLRSFARERLAAYKYPRFVAFVDELPHGATGKILRREIDRERLARSVGLSPR